MEEEEPTIGISEEEKNLNIKVDYNNVSGSENAVDSSDASALDC